MFKEIKKLNRRGYRCIVGVDEAGRGPLAGPVLACAVVLFFSSLRGDRRRRSTKQSRGSATRSPRSLRSLVMTFYNMRDSKKLSAKQREEWYKILTEHPDLKWAVASVSYKMIDKINILEATKLAMRRAVEKLDGKLKSAGYANLRYRANLRGIDFLIVDGNFILASGSRGKLARPGCEIMRQIAIPKADEKIFVCMAAGIIAKVTRDRIMKRLHKKYPEYNFAQHKGYGTKKHLSALKKYGACEIHRKSFRPIKIKK